MACRVALASMAAALLLLLAAPAHARGVLRASPVPEVQAALTQAATVYPEVAVAAGALKQLLTLSRSRVDVSGRITILLPTTLLFSKYNWTALSAKQTSAVINLLILRGQHSYASLQASPVGSTFATKNGGAKLKKLLSSPVNVLLSPADTPQGPRTGLELQTAIVGKDLVLGPRVNVQGVSSVLTPPEFKRGPFSTLPGF